jgi:hypothetical protein
MKTEAPIPVVSVPQEIGKAPKNVPTGQTYVAPKRSSASEAGLVPAHARGGPVSKGKPALVGEEGPEMVVPRRSALERFARKAGIVSDEKAKDIGDIDDEPQTPQDKLWNAVFRAVDYPAEKREANEERIRATHEKILEEISPLTESAPAKKAYAIWNEVMRRGAGPVHRLIVSDARAKEAAYSAGIVAGVQSAREGHAHVSYKTGDEYAVPEEGPGVVVSPSLREPQRDIVDPNSVGGRAGSEGPPGHVLQRTRTHDTYGMKEAYDWVPNPEDPSVVHAAPVADRIRAAAEIARKDAASNAAKHEAAMIPVEEPVVSDEDAKEGIEQAEPERGVAREGAMGAIARQLAGAARRATSHRSDTGHAASYDPANVDSPKTAAGGAPPPRSEPVRKRSEDLDPLLSSENAKTGMSLEDSAPAQMMDQIGSGISYRYKKGVPGTDPNKRHYGTTTQQLEKSEMGKSMVTQGPGGYSAIDTKEAVGPVLASLGNLNARMRRVEALKKEEEPTASHDDYLEYIRNNPTREIGPPRPPSRPAAPSWLDRYMGEQHDLERADNMKAAMSEDLQRGSALRPRLSDLEAKRMMEQADAMKAADQARLAEGPAVRARDEEELPPDWLRRYMASR